MGAPSRCIAFFKSLTSKSRPTITEKTVDSPSIRHLSVSWRDLSCLVTGIAVGDEQKVAAMYCIKEARGKTPQSESFGSQTFPSPAHAPKQFRERVGDIIIYIKLFIVWLSG